MTPVFLLILAAYSADDAGLPGVVCDIDTMKCPWKTGIVKVITNVSVTVITEQKQEITYPFHLRLSYGQVNRLALDGTSHLPRDVRIGDTIHIDIFKENNTEHCISLGIRWRPGGKVPPSLKPSDWRPAHEVLQAMGEERRFGIPLPRYLHPKARPWNYPAYHPSIEKALRLKRFPYADPWTYYEYVMYMR